MPITLCNVQSYQRRAEVAIVRYNAILLLKLLQALHLCRLHFPHEFCENVLHCAILLNRLARILQRVPHRLRIAELDQLRPQLTPITCSAVSAMLIFCSQKVPYNAQIYAVP